MPIGYNTSLNGHTVPICQFHFYLDLDRFKPVNDRWDMLLVTKYLKEAARRLVFTLRDSYMAVRFGGDDLFWSLPKPMLMGRHRLLKKFLQKLREPYIYEETSFTLGASIGIAVYPQEYQQW